MELLAWMGFTRPKINQRTAIARLRLTIEAFLGTMYMSSGMGAVEMVLPKYDEYLAQAVLDREPEG